MRAHYSLLALSLAVGGCAGGTGDTGAPSSTTTQAPSETQSSSSVSNSQSPLQRVIVWRQQSDGQRHLYIVNEDGTELRAIADGTGSHYYKETAINGRVIFESSVDGQTDIFSVNPDGTGLLNLTNSADNDTFQATTTAGTVIYSRGQQNGAQQDIYQVNTDGAQTCAIANSAQSEIFLALGADNRVIYKKCTTDSCTSGPKSWTIYAASCSSTTPITTQNVNGDLRVLGATPAGRIIFLATDDLQQGYLYSANANGSDWKQLAAARRWPTPLIHGESVVYTHAASDSQNFDIHAIAASGGEPTVLADTTEPELIQAITADGRLIYSTGVSSAPSTPYDIYSVRLDGSERRTVAGAAYREYFDTLSGTGRVLYQAGINEVDRGYELRSINSDGTNEIILASGSRSNQYRSDAITATNRIAYSHLHDGGADLYVTNEDGTGNRYLASSVGYGGSTDNDRIIYTTPCQSYSGSFEPPTFYTCRSAGGDVVAIKADGTGTTSLASGSEEEGFEAIH